MPAIRVLCEKFGASAAPPHIYAGVSSILTLGIPVQVQGIDGSTDNTMGEGHSQRRKAKNCTKSFSKIPALIVAVGLIVCACLSGKSTSPDEYAQRKTLGLDSLRGRFPPADAVPGRAEQEEDLTVDDSDTYNSAHVDAWLREIRDRRLTESDWFKNVGQGTGLSVGNGGEDEDGEEGHHEGNEGEVDEDSWTAMRQLEDGVEEKGYLQAGLGTMVGAILLPLLSSPLLSFPFLSFPFLVYIPSLSRPYLEVTNRENQMQDKLDYLSEGRQRDYQKWEQDMMTRIDRMEKEHAINVSDG